MSSERKFGFSWGESDPASTSGMITPFIVTLFFSMIMLLPVGTSLGGISLPHFAMISVFYFASRRPLTMPYGTCALSGFMLDLWLDVPLGINILLLILIRFFVLNQLKYYRGRTRLVHWFIFAMLSLSLFTVSWAILSVFNWQLMAVIPFLLHWIVTAMAYAPVAVVLGFIRKGLMRAPNG